MNQKVLQGSEDWQSWQWQLREAITDFAGLAEAFPDFEVPENAKESLLQRLPIQITPYYAQVLQSEPDLQKSLLPSLLELESAEGEEADPLNEEAQSPFAGLVHRYPNRVLLYLTEKCAVYCRYCTRGRKVGKKSEELDLYPSLDFNLALDYLHKDQGINEVILSGGDPLLLSGPDLKDKLSQLFAIPHLQILRFSTKLPLVLPQKITPQFAQIFAGPKPVYMNLHVIHPAELTPEVAKSLQNLRAAGVVLSAQTVLLKGINDDPSLMAELNQKLLSLGVRPYALYHCDPILGASHFRTTLESGVEILEHLRKTAGGMALPQFVVDPVGGKVTLGPNNLLSVGDSGYELKNWKGEKVFYPFHLSK
ncbi:MAG: KamA family radical SAM protein [SAR324 cluster bacterium]|nr:KamA family radical SAM protein [SAR324 cluster bacterium]